MNSRRARPWRAGGDAQGADAIDRLGLSVRVLTGEEKQQLRASGSLVVVDSDGAAARGRHPQRRVILAANRLRVASIEELRNAVKGSGAHGLAPGAA
jgi:serine protease Do